MCYFDDIPPEPRTKEELYVLLLNEMITGKKANLNKFYSREIIDAKRHLVRNGYLEGVVNWDEIVYSKITDKGREYLKRLKEGK